MRVLLIEDDPYDLELQRIALTNTVGVSVITASCAEDGLELALEQLPDMIICDIKLPGMNGYEFVARCKSDETLRMIPVIALTGADPSIANEAMAMEKHFDGFVSKPMNSVDMARAISKLLHGDRVQMLFRMKLRRDMDSMTLQQTELAGRVRMLEEGQNRQGESIAGMQVSMRGIEGIQHQILNMLENNRVTTLAHIQEFTSFVSDSFEKYQHKSNLHLASIGGLFIVGFIILGMAILKS